MMDRLKFIWQTLTVILSVVASVTYGKESSGVNFFNLDGTVWISGVEYNNPSMQDVDKSGLYVLGDIEHVENKDARVISSYYYDDPDGTQLGSYAVYSDEDIVYFLNPGTSEWLTLYDFSLSPGESVEMWECTLGYFPAKEPARLFAYCEDRSHLQSTPDMDIMRIKFYSSEEEFNTHPESPIGESRWIVGLGSISGPINNVDYFGVGGDISYLSMAYSKETLIYQSATAGVRNSMTDDNIKLIIDNGRIETSPSYNLTLIDVAGRIYNSSDGIINGLQKGVYIAISGNCRQKVFVP